MLSRIDQCPIAYIFFGCLFGGLIVALAVIDARRMILPDRLNLSVALTGLAQSLILGQPRIIDAAIGGVFGAATLMMVSTVFRRMRGIDGLGFGDVKFVAASGLWIGWEGVPRMLLLASVSALFCFSILALRAGKLDRTTRIAFGPFLGLGAFCAWIMSAG
jgi:leader peptidase (prepilin peptidase) / N-methyltransferase